MIGITLALLASLIWGTGTLFSRKGLQYVQPNIGVFVANSAGCSVGILAGLLLSRRELFSLSLTAVAWFALIGVISIGLANYFYYRGIYLVGASRASPIAAAAPLLSLPLAMLFLGEHATLSIAFGATGVVGGLYLVTSSGGGDKQVRKRGYIFALLAALCWSISSLLIRKGVTTFASPLAGTPISLLVGYLVLFPRQGLSTAFQARRKLWLLLAAGSCSGLGSLLFYSAMSFAPVVVVSPLGNMAPLIAITGSHLFLRRLEKVTLRLVLGALLVLAGAATITIGRAAG
ncbi:MAG: protein of unknown function transrane [Dehalococcoidia bacterium]|nr:protein of unknown function transrane [Dehalococcoidia bacterium]